jgi:filamentous hemagglutinin family protein
MKHLHTLTLALVAPLLLNSAARATPQNGAVVLGNASISSTAGSTVVTQSSAKLAIDWQSFNIGAGERVQFVQPDSQSVALNRVLGPDPSRISGNLFSNGRVFLVNPAGILFSKDAKVNVGALIASTLPLSDTDFWAGHYRFTAAEGSVAELSNQGLLQTVAGGGYVALLGHSVRNDGRILARLGSVALAAGSAITLDLGGDGLLNVVVNQGAAQAQVHNGGVLAADGGRVVLSTQAADALLQTVVNNTGIIQAQTIDSHQGVIRLLAGMQSGSVQVDGALVATGGALAGDGGLIETSAAHVTIADTARLDTRAAHGSMGTWLLDPHDFVIANAGGDISPAILVGSLLSANVTISSNSGLSGTAGDIYVNDAVHWAGASTLTLNAVHDVLVNAPITADTAGAKLVLLAGNDIRTTLPITAVAAGSTVSFNAGHDIVSGGALEAVAAGSFLSLHAENDLFSNGAITATAADSQVVLSAGRDATVGAAIIAVAANSLIRISAGRDINTTTTAAIAATAATTQIELLAQRNIAIHSAIAAGAAGSGIKLLAGLGGSVPGASSGTLTLAAAAASPSLVIRFNPDGYANTASAISLYPALADARAWVYLQGNDKVYDGSTSASLSLQGNPTQGGQVQLQVGSATFADKNAGQAKTVNYTGTQLGGLDANRFALIPSTGNTLATITPRALSVSASASNKVYDGSSGANVTLADQRVSGDQLALSYASATFADANVGNGKSIGVWGVQLFGADAANYSVSSSAATAANVTPAALQVRANDAQKIYGRTAVLTGFSTVGLVEGETIGSVQELSAGSAATVAVANVPYAISPSNASGGSFAPTNYRISYRNGMLTVLPAPLVITVANDTKRFGVLDTSDAFTAQGLVNGDTIGNFTIYKPGSAASATVAGNPYPIVFSNPKSGSYVASNYQTVYVSGVMIVLPPLPTSLPALLPGAGNVSATGYTAPALALTPLDEELPVPLPLTLPPAAPAE